MERSTRLTLKRIYIYLKWAFQCLIWNILFGFVMHPWAAGVLACLVTIELFMDPDNWREQRLMKENIIWISLGTLQSPSPETQHDEQYDPRSGNPQ